MQLNDLLIQRVGGHARAKRWRMLLGTFPDLAEMRVLDVGGEISGWQEAPVIPAQVVMLNVAAIVARETDVSWARRVQGDGCSPPASLDSEQFDLVYCNSVIEHVGGHERRVALADTIHRFAPHHWVQTPYRYFPIEPHVLAPGVQFLPDWAQAEVLRRWPLGTMRDARDEWPETKIGRDAYPIPDDQRLGELERHYALSGALSIELLSRTGLQWLFPRSQILTERIAGLPKSIIAVA